MLTQARSVAHPAPDDRFSHGRSPARAGGVEKEWNLAVSAAALAEATDLLGVARTALHRPAYSGAIAVPEMSIRGC